MLPRHVRRDLWLIVLLTLVAFVLRLTELTSRSLWLDEGFTLVRVTGSWSDLLRNIVPYQGALTVDTNTQAYFALLKLWSIAAGTTEFALKWISAAAGVLCVPLIAVLARRLVGRSAALLSAILMTLSPLAQWFGHELRMYTLVLCLACLSIYLLHRALAERSSLQVFCALAWVGCMGVAMLTHYSFAALLVVQIAYGMVWFATQRRAAPTPSSRIGLVPVLAVVMIGCVVGAIVAVAAGLPALFARLLSGAEYSFAFVPLHTIVPSIVGQILFGMNTIDPTSGVFTWLVFAFCVAGVVAHIALRLPRRANTVYLAVCAAGPVLVWFAISFIKPNFHNVRHLMLVVPPLLVLLAGLINTFGAPTAKPAIRAITNTFAVCVLAANVNGLASTFQRTPDWQDDWRALTQYIRTHWQPGDGLLENAGSPYPVTRLYLGDLPVVPQWLSSFRSMPAAEATAQLVREHPRIWFINAGGSALGEGEGAAFLSPFFITDRVRFPGRTTAPEVMLLQTTAPFSRDLPADATLIPVAVDPASTHPQLVAYRIRAGNPYAPNANFTMTLFWRGASNDIVNINKTRVTVRLFTSQAQSAPWLDQNIVIRAEGLADEWQPGMIFARDEYVPIPPGLPVQPYDLELQVRAGEKGDVVQSDRQPLSDDALACCVRVKDWRAARERWRAGDIALAIAEYPDVLKPGQPLPVALTWRAMQANTPSWETRLSLDALLGGQVAEAQQPAGTPGFPTSAWPVGELSRDLLALQTPYTAAPGWYRLSLNRYRDGRWVDGTLLGIVRLEDYPRTPVATDADIQHRLSAKVGELTLLGYTARAPLERGQTRVVFTYWRTDEQPQRDGKLFLHIVGPDGILAEQDDNSPFDNARSTLSLRPGDGIEQPHRFTLKPDAPPGEYTLYAGIYTTDGAQRWPAQQDGQPALNDLVKLGVFSLP